MFDYYIVTILSIKYLFQSAKRFNLVLFVLLFSSFVCLAQEKMALFRGIVKSEKNNELIPFATVYCKDLKKGVAADVQGFFYFRNFELGKHHFVVFLEREATHIR